MAISLGQIDLEALKNYLKIVQGFRTIDDPSGDTSLVDGVDSNKIAIAALDENGELMFEEIGREVVKNAMNLIKIDQDGNPVIIAAEDLLTDEEGRQLKNSALKSSNNTAEDMRSLRNEMYHLKLDMIKSGAVTYDQVYNGFIDPFMDVLDGLEANYTLDVVGIEGFDGTRVITQDTDSTFYKEGQYVALLSDTNLVLLTKVANSNDGLRLETAQWNSIPTSLIKTFGLYHDGKFIFASEGEQLVDANNTLNMIYKDGPDRFPVAILNESISQKGFVSTIMVPAELDNNYLSSINLSLSTKGAPGVIYCELYEYTSIDRVENRIYGDPIATSNDLSSLAVTSTKYNTYKFKFDNDILLEKGHEYALVIKANATSNNNVWEIYGFSEPCNDTIHQDTYVYNTDGSLTLQKVNTLTNTVQDIFIGLTTAELRTEELIYSKQGIYTGRFELEHAKATRVRVSFNPDLNGQTNVNNFNVYDYYKVSVMGRDNAGNYIMGTPDKLDDRGRHEAKKFSHRVLANGVLSAYEYVYDFNFDTEVDYIEFQIVYDSADAVGEERHGALYAVVVSTDNAYSE